MRALVLEPDPDESNRTVRLLQQAGYRPTVVTSLYDARILLEYQPFDLIVFETWLPDGDLLPLCAETRDRWGIGLIMLCVTCEPRPERRIAALQLGADDVIVKPYATDEFLARIEAHRRRARLR